MDAARFGALATSLTTATPPALHLPLPAST
jgi:hypothetical protein